MRVAVGPTGARRTPDRGESPAHTGPRSGAGLHRGMALLAAAHGSALPPSPTASPDRQSEFVPTAFPFGWPSGLATVLGGIVPREQPRVVFLIGQPGASKTVTAGMLRRAMRPGTIRLSSDDFKAAHPDYLQLLKVDPRGASAAIRPDYKAWFSRAEQYVRDRRADVVIESAPDSAGTSRASWRKTGSGTGCRP
ncbi:zeta toxin family protein [Streptomyces sp. NPDC056165]|uniref:zeta toxin family protein n=1 Tax=Streptomyces sp. NPDC056165 TaxID=3345733 RepID=UPI0035E233CF